MPENASTANGYSAILLTSFEKGKSYAITGPNGSGKSTLLQVLSGSMHFNEGSCNMGNQAMIAISK